MHLFVNAIGAAGLNSEFQECNSGEQRMSEARDSGRLGVLVICDVLRCRSQGGAALTPQPIRISANLCSEPLKVRALDCRLVL